MREDMLTNIISSLLVAIRVVESCDGLDVRADGNDYQITEICVEDVNRIYGTHYVWPDDARDRSAAEDIVFLYLLHYGTRYFRDYGRTPTRAVLSKIFNSGYSGFGKGRGKAYLKKIQKVDHKCKRYNGRKSK